MTAKAAERPKPIAAPPERPRVKLAGVGCFALIIMAIYFAFTLSATIAGVALAHRWGLS